jgi:ubiquinone biosynthesis protein UbiJ
VTSIVESGIERLLERIVRQARAESPRAVSLLQSLSGRRLRVCVTGTPWQVVVECTGETLRLAGSPTAASNPADTGATAAVDATITGGAIALLSLAGSDPQAVIARGDVSVTGDAEIAQQFRDLSTLLRPDLEAGLSRFIGRSGAHLALRGARALVEGARERAQTMTLNTAEYLAHESRTLVSRAEAEHFLRGVDEMRERLDRLEARLADTEQRMRNP